MKSELDYKLLVKEDALKNIILQYFKTIDGSEKNVY